MKLTVGSTVDVHGEHPISTVKSTGRQNKVNFPGPGQYTPKSLFPNGPKFIIQKKNKQDSVFMMKI